MSATSEPASRLGQREGGDRLAGARPRQPVALLRRRAEQADRPVPSPCMANAKSARPSWRASVSRDQAERAHVERAAGSPGRRRCASSQPSRPSARTSARQAASTSSWSTSARFARAQRSSSPAQLAVAVLEERPVEEASVGHQFALEHRLLPWRRTRRRRARSPSVCMQIACACASASIACVERPSPIPG